MKFTHGVLPKPATCNAHTAYKEAVIAPYSVSGPYLKEKKIQRKNILATTYQLWNNTEYRDKDAEEKQGGSCTALLKLLNLVTETMG